MITFDIETIPTNNQEIIAYLESSIAPPGNIKLPESKAKWMEENRESELKKIVSKTSLDGMYGRVACIAWGEDEDIDSSNVMMSEQESIITFYDYIDCTLSEDFCGHNLAGFDLPFLKHRSMILGIKPPGKLLKAMSAKRWDDCVKDTMLMWSPDRDKLVSMTKLCRVFGIDIDDEIDGSQVAEFWEKDPLKVINHCIADVRKTMKIYKRLTFQV